MASPDCLSVKINTCDEEESKIENEESRYK